MGRENESGSQPNDRRKRFLRQNHLWRMYLCCGGRVETQEHYGQQDERFAHNANVSGREVEWRIHNLSPSPKAPAGGERKRRLTGKEFRNRLTAESLGNSGSMQV